MEKRYPMLVTWGFCLFIGGLLLASILLPDAAFSPMENRNLQPLPELTAKRFTSGRYMTEAERYVSDHMALRDSWVALKALSERVTGKQENNGVYFAGDDTLITRLEEPDADLMDENIGQLRGFLQRTELPVYFGLIPSAAQIWSEKLPDGAPTADEALWIKKLYEQSDAQTIDLLAALEAHDDEPIYYRTDHHWTSRGAFYGANAIFEAMELEPLNPADYTPLTISDDFYGTAWSAASAWWIKPDSIERWVPGDGVEVTSNFTGKEVPGRLYDLDRLDAKDQYAVFLGGNQPICVLRSGVEGEKLLVIRDSYADCLAPFLTERFSEVHLWDLRYNRLSAADYAREQGIDRILILYSFREYMADENQFLLGR